MSIEASINCDSVANNGKRLTTFILKYPRFIHSEFMTHRVFSRNASSSRAIPIKKMIEAVEKDPAMPVWWGKNQAGMQANEALTGEELEKAKKLWLEGRDAAVKIAKQMTECGLHKQIANRVLETWSHITVVASATELSNFFNLRAHKDAQPEFQELAYKMLAAYLDSVPKLLNSNEWHMPFSDKMLDPNLTIEQKIKISVARCARVSYLTFDGDAKPEADYELYNKLSASRHMSPFEHVARPLIQTQVSFGNFKGWVQHRKMLVGEDNTEFNPADLLKNRP